MWVKVTASGEGSPAALAHTVIDGQQGSFGEALNQYFHAYRLLPAEPLLTLSIGIAFCNQVRTCAGDATRAATHTRNCSSMSQSSARHDMEAADWPMLCSQQDTLSAGDVAPE